MQYSTVGMGRTVQRPHAPHPGTTILTWHRITVNSSYSNEPLKTNQTSGTVNTVADASHQNIQYISQTGHLHFTRYSVTFRLFTLPWSLATHGIHTACSANTVRSSLLPEGLVGSTSDPLLLGAFGAFIINTTLPQSNATLNLGCLADLTRVRMVRGDIQPHSGGKPHAHGNIQAPCEGGGGLRERLFEMWNIRLRCVPWRGRGVGKTTSKHYSVSTVSRQCWK